MKKRIVLAILLTLAVASVLALTACANDPIAQLQLQCDNIINAKMITQKVEISQGDFTQYASERTYTKQGNGYKVTGTVKKINTLNSDAPYTETTIDETLQGNATLAAKIKLSADYFAAGYTLEETSGLTATVVQSHVKEFLSLTDADITAPTGDVGLKLTLTNGNLTGINLSYTSNGSDVAITITVSY